MANAAYMIERVAAVVGALIFGTTVALAAILLLTSSSPAVELLTGDDLNCLPCLIGRPGLILVVLVSASAGSCIGLVAASLFVGRAA